jgi:DNA-binding PucR family transcriptional regulator
MLDTIKESEDLKRFCSPQVFDVIEYDAEYNTSYSITAYAFLCANRNPAQAAERLGIHRNTVDYRIKRLEELFGIDFESSEATFSLELSFRILQFLALPPFGPDSMVH